MLAPRFNRSQLTEQQKKRIQLLFSQHMPGLMANLENESPLTSLDTPFLSTRPAYLNDFDFVPSPFADTYMFVPKPVNPLYQTNDKVLLSQQILFPNKIPFICQFCDTIICNALPRVVLQLVSSANPWVPVCDLCFNKE